MFIELIKIYDAINILIIYCLLVVQVLDFTCELFIYLILCLFYIKFIDIINHF